MEHVCKTWLKIVNKHNQQSSNNIVKHRQKPWSNIITKHGQPLSSKTWSNFVKLCKPVLPYNLGWWWATPLSLRQCDTCAIPHVLRRGRPSYEVTRRRIIASWQISSNDEIEIRGACVCMRQPEINYKKVRGEGTTYNLWEHPEDMRPPPFFCNCWKHPKDMWPPPFFF
jgi:hypothetical protein